MGILPVQTEQARRLPHENQAFAESSCTSVLLILGMIFFERGAARPFQKKSYPDPPMPLHIELGMISEMRFGKVGR